MSLTVNDVDVERYFFPSIEVVANTSHETGEESLTSFLVNETLHATPDPLKYAMELMVASDEEGSKNLPYTFKISAFGFFHVRAQEPNEEHVKAACARIGRVILMGAVREQIAILTSRGPWETIHLRAIPAAGVHSIAPTEEPETAK